jgi:hypothetical protein
MPDVDGAPDTQIRDNSYPIPTLSLQAAGNEVVPDELVRDLLQREWLATEAAPTPRFLVKDEAMQADLARGDALVVEVENYEDRFTGHRHEFVDVEVSIGITVRSVHSRQRMWNLMAECRRIVYRWILALQPYHSLYFDGFQPDYLGPKNFSGIMRIRLTAGAVPVFKRRVGGEESPSTDPGQFPGGV